MSKLAFVFPGQGSQYPGMGKELAENYEAAARVFAEADDIAGYKLSELCFCGPEDILNRTEFSQPAILTASLAILAVVKEYGITPFMLAGNSLGEYTALVAAGSISFQEALPLVQTRARLMQAAVPPEDGAMAAIMGLDNDQILAACQKVKGIVDISNYNCPGQVVISGDKEAVLQVCLLVKNAGGRSVPLAISVPCHSPLLREAAASLKPYLARVNWDEPIIPVVSNVNAKVNSCQQFIDLLETQLYSPVMWEQSVRYMLPQVDYFIEVGPGSSLSGLIKKVDRTRILGQIDNIRSLEKTIEKVKSL